MNGREEEEILHVVFLVKSLVLVFQPLETTLSLGTALCNIPKLVYFVFRVSYMPEIAGMHVQKTIVCLCRNAQKRKVVCDRLG